MGRLHRPESNTEAINAMAGKYRTKAPRPPSRKRKPSVRPVPPQARAGSGDGVSMAARSFVACAATWRAVSPPSAARCAMSDSLSRRPPFPQRRHPTATPPGENRGEPVRAQRGGLAPAPVGGRATVAAPTRGRSLPRRGPAARRAWPETGRRRRQGRRLRARGPPRRSRRGRRRARCLPKVVHP